MHPIPHLNPFLQQRNTSITQYWTYSGAYLFSSLGHLCSSTLGLDSLQRIETMKEHFVLHGGRRYNRFYSLAFGRGQWQGQGWGVLGQGQEQRQGLRERDRSRGRGRNLGGYGTGAGADADVGVKKNGTGAGARAGI